jgi:ACS family glucarate transporter-like MFS transporter
MGAQLGGALTSSLTPWIAKEFGWTASFLVAAALCLTGSITWLLVEPDR